MKTLLAVCFALAAAAAAAQTVDADLQTIKQRLRDSLLPSRDADRIAIEQRAKGLAARLRKDGTWPDIPYDEKSRSNWAVADHLARTLLMAKACALPGRHNVLARQTLDALQLWLDRDYTNPNWWWNQIGVPQQIAEIVILLEDHVTPAQKAKAIEILKRAPLSGTGANLLWLAGNNIMRGLIEGDAGLVKTAYDRLYAEIRVVGPTEEGVQADYSFHQHGAQFYSGGYGYVFGNDNARYTSFALGTRFAIPPANLDVLLHYLLDGQQWMIRGAVFDYSAVGREITRKGKVAAPKDWRVGPISPVGAAYGLANAARQMAAVPTSRQAELKALSARLNGEPGTKPLQGHRHFWDSDYTAHQRAGYLASVRMYSDRTLNTEIVNSEGKKSHHLADGCNMLYRTGWEYADCFPAWDWEHIPGTTVERRPEPFTPANPQQRGKSSFVGGVSDGLYGATAMDLRRDNLAAKKAWFFFDDEYVCLGAGITCSVQDPVITTLNQCLLRDPVRVSGSGEPVARGDHSLGGLRWVLHDGVGYWFPVPTDVRLINQPRTGSWSAIGTGPSTPVTVALLDLWLDHGAGPRDASYAYVVVPGADAASLNAMTAASPYGILSNTVQLQAVQYPALRQQQMVFYAPGKCVSIAGWNVWVDQPCIAMLREEGGKVAISVANPRNTPLTVALTVDRRLEGSGIIYNQHGSEVTFVLPGGLAAGSTVTRHFTQG